MNNAMTFPDQSVPRQKNGEPVAAMPYDGQERGNFSSEFMHTEKSCVRAYFVGIR